ncbi:DUF1330 domain-containing protein [Xanthovirga aplysinae]|uniref:DUF1330 domain-containing protein n=1 Tax=Xanthovirga aplysinae TaxID=2529853 RepID=UPI0012BD4E4E|nr:DUF1330 domain-containing protein [Xanthovirga aplysinae]MTI32139.1 DUF1330 domain-containing protein [Xanthovirga aplysinae]
MSKVNLIIVAKINPKESEALTHYLGNVGKLFEQVKAKPVGRYQISEASIGEYTPSAVTVVEFPNKEAVNEVFDSEAYKELLPYREKAFTKLEAYIS